jgi:hypothetical protein
MVKGLFSKCSNNCLFDQGLFIKENNILIPRLIHCFHLQIN